MDSTLQNMFLVKKQHIVTNCYCQWGTLEMTIRKDELTLSPLGPGGPEIPLSPGIPWRPGGPPSPSAPVGPGLPCVEKWQGQQVGCNLCTFHSLIFLFIYCLIFVNKKNNFGFKPFLSSVISFSILHHWNRETIDIWAKTACSGSSQCNQHGKLTHFETNSNTHQGILYFNIQNKFLYCHTVIFSHCNSWVYYLGSIRAGCTRYAFRALYTGGAHFTSFPWNSTLSLCLQSNVFLLEASSNLQT